MKKDTSTANPVRKPSRLRRWLKRALITIGVCLMLLVVFHGPILRFALDRGVRWFASREGYQVTWKVAGSVTSNITINDVVVTAPAGSPLRKLSVKQLSASYDLLRLMRDGRASFVQGITLNDADLEFDFRGPAAGAKPAAPSSAVPSRMENYWIGRVDIRNANVRATTAEGDIIVSGFTLLLEDDKPGVISMDDLQLPSGQIHLQNIRGTTRWRDHRLEISDLNITPDTSIALLTLGLGTLSSDEVPFHIELRSGAASLQTEGKVTAIRSNLAVAASVDLQNLTNTDLARWIAMPVNVSWQIDNSHLSLNGPVNEPRKMEGKLSASASKIITPVVKTDKVTLSARLHEGKFEIEKLAMESATGEIALSAKAEVPAKWEQMNAISSKVSWKIGAPAIEEFFTGKAVIAGAIESEGTATLRDGAFASADGKLAGAGLRVADIPLESLTAEISTDAKTLNIRSFDVKLVAANHANISGTIELREGKPANLNWSISLPDIATAAKAAGLNEEEFSSGSLEADGKTSFSIDDVTNNRFEAVKLDGTLLLKNITWQGRTLQGLQTSLLVHDGLAEVREMNVRLDDANIARLNASMKIAEPQALHASWDISLQDLTGVMRGAGVKLDPPDLHGAITSKGEATMPLSDLRAGNMSALRASMALDVAGVEWRGARVEGVTLNAKCEDGKVMVSKFDAQLTPHNHLAITGDMLIEKPLSFHADVSGDLAQLAELTPLLKAFDAPAITAGSATISWKGAGGATLLDVSGSGDVHVSELKIATWPDPVSLAIETRHGGGHAEVRTFHVVTGKWSFDAAASFSADELKLTSLSLDGNGVRLVDGSASIPLVLSQVPRPALPVDPKRDIAIRLQTKDLDFAKLFALIGQKSPITGIAKADVDFHGPLPALEGKVSLTISKIGADVTKGKLDPASLQFDGVLVSQKLTLDAVVVQKPLQTLVAHAELPLDVEKIIAQPSSLMETNVEALVRLPDSDLSIVKKFVPDLTEVRGNFGLEVHAKGPLREPQLEGSLHLDAPALTFRQTDYPTGKNLKALITFAGRKITLNELSGLLSGGELRASGSVDLTNVNDPAFDFRADAKEALIMRNETVSLRTNAALTCQGTLAKSHIAGSVDLVRGRVFKEIEFLPLSLPNQLPPPPPPSRVSAPGAGMPLPFANWTMGVDVNTHDPIRLMGNVFSGGVVVALKAGGTLGKPEIEGKVWLEDARLRLPFSRLAISRGNLIFTKEKPWEPELDLQADSRVSDYEVTLFATGSVFAPKLRFMSSPPLSEGDIATLLATGATAGGLGASEGVAANRAAYLVITKLYRRLFKKAVTNRYDDEPPKISVDFSALNVGSTQRSVTVTYELSKNLQVKGSVNADSGFRGLFYYVIRFK